MPFFLPIYIYCNILYTYNQGRPWNNKKFVLRRVLHQYFNATFMQKSKENISTIFDPKTDSCSVKKMFELDSILGS